MSDQKKSKDPSDSSEAGVELSAQKNEKQTSGGASKDSQKGAPAVERKEETAADLLRGDLNQVKIRRAKGSKNISYGICKINATYNNTKVAFTDLKGQVISWSSAGKCGFRGARKSTAYSAQVVTQDAGRVAMGHGLREVNVHVRGPGMGRDSAVRALQSLGLTVRSLVDTTPIPHNGCRARKHRRA